jgi:hypothetical protein
MNAKTTKAKAIARRTRRSGNGLRREYRFDYKKSKSNRFAGRLNRDVVVVVLDSDVAAVFRDGERVNSLLRATIAALEKRTSRRAG